MTTDEAFDRLRRYCRSHNLRLGEMARGVVAGEVEMGFGMAGPAGAGHGRTRGESPEGGVR